VLALKQRVQHEVRTKWAQSRQDSNSPGSSESGERRDRYVFNSYYKILSNIKNGTPRNNSYFKLFNVETLQAFGALFKFLHYYRKFLHCKSKMLCNYVILN
jgi:hypothetical protein